MPGPTPVPRRRTRRPSAPIALLAVLASALVAGAAASPALPAAPVRADGIHLTLPAPTGPYPIGVRMDEVSDPSVVDPTTGRARRIPIWVWYPARNHSTGPTAPYLSPVVQAFAESAVGAPAGLFDTHAIADAPARRHVRGVVLLEPGGGSISAFQTGQVIDLASRGYAVVAMDHPHGSFLVVEPDGTMILGDDDNFPRRVADARVVLDAVPRLVPEAGRDTPIGMFGHSRGAAAVAEVMFHDDRVDAGVGLDIGTVLFTGEDGTPPGDVVTGGLDRPFGTLCSLIQPCDSLFVADLLARVRAPHPARTLSFLHNGFTDFALFNPQIAKVDPALAAVLEVPFDTGLGDDVLRGRRALEVQRRFLARFFGTYLVKEARPAAATGR